MVVVAYKALDSNNLEEDNPYLFFVGVAGKDRVNPVGIERNVFRDYLVKLVAY